MTAAMGSKRGQGRGSFVSSVLDLVDEFYGSVVQGLRPWAAAPPKMRALTPAGEEGQEGVAPALVSTALSSQDGAEPAGAPEQVELRLPRQTPRSRSPSHTG